MSIGFQSHAQVSVNYTCNNLILNTYSKSIQGKVEIEITNNSVQTIDTLSFVFWPAAYLPKGTFLANEMLENQDAKMRFAKEKDLGYTGYTYSTTSFTKDAILGEEEQFQIAAAIHAGESKSVFITFLAKLPAASFNGFGYDQNTIRLSHFLPEVVPPGEKAVLNSINRESWSIAATYDLQLSTTEGAQLITNLDAESITEKKWHLKADKPVYDALILFSTAAREFNIQEKESLVKLIFGEDFPPFNQVTSWDKVTQFLFKELGWKPAKSSQIAFFGKQGLQSTGNLYLLKPEQSQEDLEGDLVKEIVSVLAREELHINPVKHPWLVEGLANYYKHLFFEKHYPNKKLLGPFSKSIVAKVFDIDHYPIRYQNRMLFLYMDRQGLSQPLSDPVYEFSRANREAIIKGKSSMVYAYARSYVGDKNYRRSMHRWLKESQGENNPQDFVHQLNYYHNADIDWLLGELYTTPKKLDYGLSKTKNCSYVYTATIKNKGKLIVPYSITGIKDSNEVLTQWFEGHNGKRTVQIHLEDYTKIRLDAAEAMPEYNQKNNSIKTTGLFRRVKPLKLQFYTSFENPEKTQIFWLPSIKYNAYDKILLGAQFYNTSLFRKPFEYRLAPDYSTGTGSLTGMASFRFNWTPTYSPFHLISFGVYGRYYHYDKGLAYLRLSPTLTLNFRKPRPRSEWISSLRIRSVSVDKETPTNPEDITAAHANPNYQIVDVRFKTEKGSLLTPFIAFVDVQFADKFSKLSLDIKQRWRFSKYHLLTARFFSGVLVNYADNQADDFFQFGLSGTQDYLFDYYFLGRSDETGIWSQQMFVTDGGFKSAMIANDKKVFDRGIIAANLNMPFFRYFGAFGDVGFTLGANNQFYWDYGLYLEFIPDFFEIYFPIQSSTLDNISQPDYYKQIRFVLNLELEAILNRVRRGLY